MTVIDERLGDLQQRIPNASILTDPDVTESYRQDWAAVTPTRAGRSRSYAPPHREDVQIAMRWATPTAWQSSPAARDRAVRRCDAVAAASC